MGKILEYAQWTHQNGYREHNEDLAEAIFYLEPL